MPVFSILRELIQDDHAKKYKSTLIDQRSPLLEIYVIWENSKILFNSALVIGSPLGV